MVTITKIINMTQGSLVKLSAIVIKILNFNQHIRLIQMILRIKYSNITKERKIES